MITLGAEAARALCKYVGLNVILQSLVVSIVRRTVAIIIHVYLIIVDKFGIIVTAEGLSPSGAEEVRNLAGGKLGGGAGAHVTVRSVASITADGLLCGIAGQERAIVFPCNATVILIIRSYRSGTPAVLRSTTIIEAHDTAGTVNICVNVTCIVAVANHVGASADDTAAVAAGVDFIGIAAHLHSAGVIACDTANVLITAYKRIVHAACDNTVVSACDAANAVIACDGGICEGHSLHLTVIVNIAKQTNIVYGAVIEVQPGDGLAVAVEDAVVSVGLGADGRPIAPALCHDDTALGDCTVGLEGIIGVEVDIRYQFPVDFGIAAVDLGCKPVKLACVVYLIIALFLVIYCGLECIALGADAIFVCMLSLQGYTTSNIILPIIIIKAKLWGTAGGYSQKLGAATKSAGFNHGYAVRNFNARQSGAVTESIRADCGYAIRNFNARQSGAFVKCAIH